MKKIAINGRFLEQKVTGVQRYAREILLELDKCIVDEDIELIIPSSVTERMPYKNIKVVKVGKSSGVLWEQFSYAAYVISKKALALNLCNSAPVLCPGIVCIHDVKIKARPQDFSKKFLAWYIFMYHFVVKRAKEIVTVSEFSKREICKYYRINEEKVIVNPNGWQHFQRIPFDEHTLEKYKLKREEYFFSMGSLEPNKNFRWIADAALRNPQYLFVVAGAINQKVFSQKLGFECPANMILIGYVTDAEAKTLMRDACAFLFPSFYEGFGIPPLEALSVNTSVICSDIPVMHELFEEYVEYIDPQIPCFEYSRNEQGDKSRILEKFSWEKSAKKIYKLIKGNKYNEKN